MPRKNIADQCASGMAAAAWLSVIARGQCDKYLYEGAKTSLFKSRYQKCTVFSFSTHSQTFDSCIVKKGKHSRKSVTLSKTGDTVTNMFMEVRIPGIIPQLGSLEHSMSPAFHGNDIYRRNLTKSQSHRINEQYLGGSARAGDDDDGAVEMDQLRDVEMRKVAQARANVHGVGVLPPESATSYQYYNANDKQYESTSHFCHWTNAIGQAMFDTITLKVGDLTVDEISSEYMFVWDELTESRSSLEMVGKRYTTSELVEDSRSDRVLYVPIPFWFEKKLNKAMALASLAFNSVEVSIDCKNLDSLIVKSHPNIVPVTIGSGGNQAISPEDIQVSLVCQYAHLDKEEREVFTSTKHDTPATQVKEQSVVVNKGAGEHTMKLNFQHPVSELIFVVRTQDNEDSNNWMDFSDGEGKDPIKSAEIQANNMSIVNGPAQYFRQMQPYCHHSNIPNAHVYCYSFAARPEDSDPTGSLNFSRVDNISLTVNFSDSVMLQKKELIVFARNWNVIEYNGEGQGQCRFMSS